MKPVGSLTVVVLLSLQLHTNQAQLVTVTEQTWVTSRDGWLNGSLLSCHDCTLHCDEGHSCESLLFSCESGNCSVFCSETDACKLTKWNDTNETISMNVSCAADRSCDYASMSWRHPSSLVDLFTDVYSSIEMFIDIIGPDSLGNPKQFNQNCEEFRSCRFSMQTQKANVSLRCIGHDSCFTGKFDLSNDSSLNLDCSGTNSCGWSSFKSESSSVSLKCTGHMSCAPVHLDYITDSAIWIRCEEDTRSCLGWSPSRIRNLSESELILECGVGGTQACDWVLDAHYPFVFSRNNLTLIDAPLEVECTAPQSCFDNDILVMYDHNNLDWNCTKTENCEGNEIRYITRAPTVTAPTPATTSPTIVTDNSNMTVKEQTWVTSSDGSLTQSTVYCHNCEVHCDEESSCEMLSLECETGDCKVICSDRYACRSAIISDTADTLTLKLSCTAPRSCDVTRLYWKESSSMVSLSTSYDSSRHLRLFIHGPDSRGNPKQFHMKCTEFRSCIVDLTIERANVSFECTGDDSCESSDFRIKEDSSLFLNCTGPRSCEWSDFYSQQSSVSLICSGNEACDRIELERITNSTVTIDCTASKDACVGNQRRVASEIGYMARSSLNINCGADGTQACDWLIIAEEEQMLAENNLTLIDAMMKVECTAKMSCLDNDIVVMYDRNNLDWNCTETENCEGNEIMLMSYSPSAAPTMGSSISNNLIIITNDTWMTIVNGSLKNKDVICDDCHIICDEYLSCQSSDIQCLRGDCNVICLAPHSCESSIVYDTEESKTLQIDCADENACYMAHFHWLHSFSSNFNLLTSYLGCNSSHLYLKGSNADSKGLLSKKIINVNCNDRESCSFLSINAQTKNEIFLQCDGYQSCLYLELMIKDETVLNMNCTGNSSCFGTRVLMIADESVLSLNCIAHHACVNIGLISLIDQSSALIVCDGSNSACSSVSNDNNDNQINHQNWIANMSDSELILECVMMMTKKCDNSWNLIAESAYAFQRNMITLKGGASSAMSVTCMVSYSCINNVIQLIVLQSDDDQSDWTMQCNVSDSCVNNTVKYLSDDDYYPSVSPTQPPTMVQLSEDDGDSEESNQKKNRSSDLTTVQIILIVLGLVMLLSCVVFWDHHRRHRKDYAQFDSADGQDGNEDGIDEDNEDEETEMVANEYE